MVGREDADGVGAVEDGVGFVVEAAGGEEDAVAVAGGVVVVRVEVEGLVGHEGEGEDFVAEFQGQGEEGERLVVGGGLRGGGGSGRAVGGCGH